MSQVLEDYAILEFDDPYRLTDAMKAKSKTGWMPLGGVSTRMHENTDGSYKAMYCQAMAKINDAPASR